MSQRRMQRVAGAVREAVSEAILREMKDPRAGFVTVLGVEVSADLRLAKVYVSVMGTERQQELAMYALEHAAGFLQAHVAKRLELRYTPVLRFIQDDSVKHSVEISRLIDEAVGRSPGRGETDETSEPDSPE